MITNVPYPTFAVMVPVLTWKEDLSATVLMDSLRVPCRFAKILTNARKWVTNVPSDATTYQDPSVVFAPMVTHWPLMVVIVKMLTNAQLQLTIANSPVKT